MAFVRQIKKGNAIYLAKVESYREDGKVKQRVLEYVGKKEDGLAVVKTDLNQLNVSQVKRYADISVLIQLAQELKLNYLLGKHHKSIIALVIAHLLCKGSIVSISTWAEHTTLYEELGLEPLSTKKLYEAIETFKINTKLFPTSWNAYDSYGEALLKEGQQEEAIKMYRKSLTLNPGNESGRKVLEAILKQP